MPRLSRARAAARRGPSRRGRRSHGRPMEVIDGAGARYGARISRVTRTRPGAGRLAIRVGDIRASIIAVMPRAIHPGFAMPLRTPRRREFPDRGHFRSRCPQRCSSPMRLGRAGVRLDNVAVQMLESRADDSGLSSAGTHEERDRTHKLKAHPRPTMGSITSRDSAESSHTQASASRSNGGPCPWAHVLPRAIPRNRRSQGPVAAA